MTPSGVFPNIGLALDAWTGAKQTVLAEEVPPIEFVSPDGRCVLAAKATELDGGVWHYEYALANVDMDRKVASFSIPVSPGTTITNAGYHLVESHDEPYSNSPWLITFEQDAIVWSTEDNPLRWGTLYNFRFDADAPPGDTIVTLGLFEPGDPMTVTGETTGPLFEAAPNIVHGETDTSFGEHGFGGYIDPRAESDNGINVNLGMNEFTIHFNMVVEDIDGSPADADSFEVRETGAMTPPGITNVATTDAQTFIITLSRNITLQEWTTIEANVRSRATGIPIDDAGDLGPGVDETDRIDVGMLPADSDQSSRVEPLDLLDIRQIFLGNSTHTQGVDEDFADIDRDGILLPADLLKFRQLIFGMGTSTRAWALEEMLHPRP